MRCLLLSPAVVVVRNVGVVITPTASG
ncbi:uncharacterized protein METZ01_LOCUS56769 [marine metagenome]|uniref:Uncharacterized protein n=1 Tax=marine metagenome TaxID=408172 RepID=A0A381SIP5_9ZZZZ